MVTAQAPTPNFTEAQNAFLLSIDLLLTKIEAAISYEKQQKEQMAKWT